MSFSVGERREPQTSPRKYEVRKNSQWASLGLPHGSVGSESPKISINYGQPPVCMAIRFPSQNKLWYQTGTIGTGLTGITSGGTSGHLNLPKDLSLLNRRGYASTTRKGVPLNFRCKVDYYLQDEDQNGVSAAVGSDFASTLDIFGCQNNWVMRNAAVKWHAAREAQLRSLKVKRSDRGAYAHEIRYGYDAYTDNWLVPIDGNGDAFTGGTWDQTKLSTPEDADFGEL